MKNKENLNANITCPSCGGIFERRKALFLITPNEAERMYGKHRIVPDAVLSEHLNRFGTPAERRLRQVAFKNEPPNELAEYIQLVNGRWCYTPMEGSKPSVRIRNHACPFCHSNISNVLRANTIRTCVLVAPPESGKTTALCSLYNCCAANCELAPGFAPGSFEQTYYSRLAAALYEGLVPDPTPFIGENYSNRQPLFFLRQGNENLTVLIDQSGENLTNGQFYFPSKVSSICFMIDGEHMMNPPITEYVSLSTQFPDVDHYIIVINKKDMLDNAIVRRAMLSTYPPSIPFTYNELRIMRRFSMPEVLREHFPDVYNLYRQLTQTNKHVDVLFIAALGSPAQGGILLKPYNPYGIEDFAYALTTD